VAHCPDLLPELRFTRAEAAFKGLQLVVRKHVGSWVVDEVVEVARSG